EAAVGELLVPRSLGVRAGLPIFGAVHPVRQQLQPPTGGQMSQPLEMSVARHAAGRLLRNECADGVLVAATDHALELHTPRLDAVARESQLAERDAELGGPAGRVDGRCRVPHGVPGVVGLVDRLDPVFSYAGRIDAERERRAM